MLKFHSFPSLHEDGVRSILYALTTPNGLRGILFDLVEKIEDQENLPQVKTKQKRAHYAVSSGYQETF
jgi:hypothetical protein